MPDIQSTSIAGATFEAPYTEDGGKEIANSGPLENSAEHRAVELTIVVSALVPNSDMALVGYRIRVQLEERVAESPDAWVIRAISDEWNAGFEKTHVVVLRPGAVTDPGSPELLGPPDEPTLVSRYDGVLPPHFRIRVMKRIFNTERDDLTSVTMTGYLKTYNLVNG